MPSYTQPACPCLCLWDFTSSWDLLSYPLLPTVIILDLNKDLLQSMSFVNNLDGQLCLFSWSRLGFFLPGHALDTPSLLPWFLLFIFKCLLNWTPGSCGVELSCPFFTLQVLHRTLKGEVQNLSQRPVQVNWFRGASF